MYLCVPFLQEEAISDLFHISFHLHLTNNIERYISALVDPISQIENFVLRYWQQVSSKVIDLSEKIV